MNESERKLDELLRQLPKPEYDLDGWMSEDETATFDRIVAGRKARTVRMRWPWVAAAASLIIIIGIAAVLKFASHPTAPTQTMVSATLPDTVPAATSIASTEETPSRQKAEPPAKKPVRRVKRRQPTATPQPLLAQELPTVEEPTAIEAANSDLAAVEPKPAEPKPVTLTERDIPITRPENYRYTPEEIALMKRQANEAYLKWIELELEIAKNNLEQVAQQ